MQQFQWWCVARGEAWTWEWRAYPGVWLFVLAVALIYWRFGRAPGRAERSRLGTASAIVAIVLLWLTLDWPAGALGAGYLAFVHALQFVMLGMVIPGLMLHGVTPESWRRLERSPWLLALLERSTNPPVAALIFTGVMIATHAPDVLDPLMRSQFGNFVFDLLWFGAGFILAWPIVASVPARPRFNPALRILYIFLGTVAHVFIAMWLLSTQYPVYASYELAPRVAGIAAMTDQHLAGAVMLMIGTPIIMLAMTIIFFRWQGTGAEPETEPT